MTLVPARPVVGVFAVDDTSAQVVWRHLRPGALHLAVDHGHGHAGCQRTLEVAGGPGATVIDGLPAGQALTLRASGDALGGSHRKVRFGTLEVLAGERLCQVATLSDLHLGARTFGHFGTIAERPEPEVLHPRRCAQAALDQAVAWGADRVVVKGDLTHAGLPDQWRAYAALVSTCPVPVDAVAGNHDNAYPKSTHSLTADQASGVFGLAMDGPTLVRDLPGLRLVLADSTLPGRNFGSLGTAADEVVDAAAEADPSGAVLVALHHHLHSTRLGEGWPRGIGHAESLALMQRLGRAHPHVVVTSGHTHRHRRWEHAGVVATQVGSTKDFPGVWAGYVVHEGGLRQIVRRVARPDCLAWTDRTRRAVAGMWGPIAVGRLDARCFNLSWSAP